ncbi:MAG: hypothetical protein KAR00_00830 [Candidatus Pacebacteria bacterium]|nr:hypothetical protein [Candidatus Paceibacterota bacterium]
MKKNVYALILVGIVAFVALYFFRLPAEVAVIDFESCALAGNPVMESYPRRCTDNGVEYVEDVGNELEKSDLIRIFSPRPGTTITSPLIISGEARGTWFFEASFPVELFDADGNKLGTAVASAQGDWMTKDFVLFSATLSFDVSEIEKGVLVLKKNNPSGLPEHNNELFVPIKFGAQKSVNNQAECLITGCSGQICAEEEMVTTCEYRPEYGCFQESVCEIQANGKCGWTETSKLQACLNSFTQ